PTGEGAGDSSPTVRARRPRRRPGRSLQERSARIMLAQTIQDAMNEQIKHEFDSAYLYLSMSAYCESNTLPGFARWLTVQAREEIEHAMKFYTFIHDRNGRVQLKALDQPPV